MGREGLQGSHLTEHTMISPTLGHYTCLKDTIYKLRFPGTHVLLCKLFSGYKGTRKQNSDGPEEVSGGGGPHSLKTLA